MKYASVYTYATDITRIVKVILNEKESYNISSKNIAKELEFTVG